jgi:hypothetical protein
VKTQEQIRAMVEWMEELAKYESAQAPIWVLALKWVLGEYEELKPQTEMALVIQQQKNEIARLNKIIAEQIAFVVAKTDELRRFRGGL